LDNPITKITGAFRKAAPDLADLRKRLQVAEEALLVARATAARTPAPLTQPRAMPSRQPPTASRISRA